MSSSNGDTTGREYTVGGMSCQSCATKVSNAVGAVADVTGVTVDPATGRLTVSGDAADSAVRAAVTGAGYTITSP